MNGLQKIDIYSDLKVLSSTTLLTATAASTTAKPKKVSKNITKLAEDLIGGLEATETAAATEKDASTKAVAHKRAHWHDFDAGARRHVFRHTCTNIRR